MLTSSIPFLYPTDAHAWHATLKKTSQRKLASRAAKKAASKSAKKVAPKAEKIPEGETAPIDELEEQLYSVYKNKKTKALKVAYDSLEAQKYAAAKKAAQSVVSDSRFGDYARWISAQASIQEAHAALEKKEFEAAAKEAQSAITLLTPLTAKFPYSPLLKSLPHQLAMAEGLLGRAQCGSEKWSACQATLEGAFVRVLGTPDMAYVEPEELSSYAQACSQKKSEFCLSWVQRLAGYYSRSTEEFKAIAKVFPEYKERLPRAPSFARQSQSYRAPDLDQAAIDQAMQLYLDGKNRDAIDAFRKFTDEYPRSSARFRALYWLAQALKKQGKEDESRRLLGELQKSSPLTYYGLLAAIETGVDPHSTLDPKAPMGTDFDPFLHPLEIYRLRRAQNLIASKAYGLAAIELKDLRARDGLSNGFLVYLAMLHSEAKSWVTAFPILNELIARGYTGAYSEFFSSVIFPIDPLKEVKKFSEAQKIDPVLVMSLIKQESSFDQSASSGSGALGLMQLMPTTAVDTVSGIARSELLTPEANLKTGTIYLSKLLNRFQGNIVYATASYNAGPGAVNRWIKAAPQGRPMLEFIEAIPYKETREYVMAIIRNYFWYTHRLYPEQSQHLKLDFFWHNYGPQVSLMTTGTTDNSAQADEPIATPSAVVSQIPSNVKASPSPSASASPAPSDSAESLGSLLGSPAPSASPSALPAMQPLGIPPENPSAP
jgi:soluble lytic murein transglycosylase-like protein